MKLTIDTSADSHHDIRKAIRLLQSIIGENETFTNEPEQPRAFDNPQPEVSGFMNMFDTPIDTPESKPDKPTTTDIPEVEFF